MNEKKRQLLWIGCWENSEEFQSKAKKGYKLASAIVSQGNLIAGIELVSGLIFDSINGAVTPPYPVYEDSYVEQVTWSHKKSAFDISVGYKNKKYINRVNCKKAMIKAAEEWIETRYQGGELTVIAYSMRSAPMATACRIKKLVPRAKIFLIITDLPQFMDLGQSMMKAILKKIDWLSIKIMQKRFDGFILYATKMAGFLHIPDGKWLLMEGSYDVQELPYFDSVKNKKAIMYSGTLDKEYGIHLLLEAFMSIEDPQIELWLTGGGNAEDYIKKCSQIDNRIIYYGFLPNRQDVLKMQKEASLLINLRLPSEPASNYCFPSKLLEYMATGIPVLSFRIGGIPEEYLPFLYIIDNESVNDLKEKIIEVLSLDDSQRMSVGSQAKQFVMELKSTEMQCKKIWEFIINT